MDLNLAWPWSIINEDSAVPSSVVIPGWANVETDGIILHMKTRVVVRPLEDDQDRMPPQLIISHFCCRSINSSSDVDAAEDARFTFREPFYYINYQPVRWREQIQRMLSRVTANRVCPDNLYQLVRGFHRYTFSVVRQFPITELVSIEFFNIIEIPVTPSASAGNTRYVYSPETLEYLDSDIDDYDYIVRYLQMVTPVEGIRSRLQLVTAEEGSLCPICLDDFEVMSQVLAMPCGHPFHERCLAEWLKRKNSCPLCRFSIPTAAAAEQMESSVP